MSARREKRLRNLERRVAALEVSASYGLLKKEIDLELKRREATPAPEPEDCVLTAEYEQIKEPAPRKRGLLQRIKDFFA